MTITDGPVLLYDGTCGFCHATVQFVLRRDTKKTLRFASLGGEYGRSIIDARPDLDGVDSIVWLESATDVHPVRILTRSAAALRIARYLGGAWRLMLVFTVVPRPIRDWVYDLVARHRHRLIASTEQCIVPPPGAHDRFLDGEL
jgi:predicted DCC family thiol-disulfide oxidoreductase YuxK